MQGNVADQFGPLTSLLYPSPCRAWEEAFYAKDLPEGGGFEFYLGGVGNLNLNCQVLKTPFFLFRGIQVVPNE